MLNLMFLCGWMVAVDRNDSNWKTQTDHLSAKHGSGIATNMVDDQSILIILYEWFSPYYLVAGLEVWNMLFHRLGIMIPIDELHHFSEG